MRPIRRLACLIAALALVASAWACSSFEAAPVVEPDAAVADASETIEPDAGFTCNRIGQPIDERFEVEPAFTRQSAGGGTIGIDGGELVARIIASNGNGNAQRAYYTRTVPVPSGRAFGHARIRYTFKGLVPPTSYLEAGCAIILHQRGNGTSSAVRVELRPNAMRLDDVVFLDGGASDSGTGDEMVSLARGATDYPVAIDVTLVPDGGLSSVGSIPGNIPVRKTTPVLDTIETIDLHCGIDSASVPDGGEYTVRIDDVAIDLCSR